MFAGFPNQSGLHPDHTSPRNIYGIGDFRAHIFCPKTTQELHEAGQPEKNRFRHTRHYEVYKEV